MSNDELKKAILDILVTDAKRSVDDIATMLQHPKKKIKELIEKMEQDKTILTYKAVINRAKFDSDKTTCLIEVQCSPQRGVGFDAIAERIYKFPEVRSLYLMSGGCDLMLLIEGETMRDVAFFVAEKLATLDHVKSTTTHFLLKRYKEDGFILTGQTNPSRLAIAP